MRKRVLFTLLGLVPLAALLTSCGPGTLDTSFGGDGIVTTSFGSTARVNALVVESSGTVFAIGRVATNSGDVAVAKYKDNGDLDTSFSGDGKASFDFNNGNPGATSQESGVFGQLQPSGNLVFVASHRAASGGGATGGAIVRRVTTNGTLDSGYSAGADGFTLGNAEPAAAGSAGGSGAIGYGAVVPTDNLRYQRSDADGNFLDSDAGNLSMKEGSLVAALDPNGKIVVAGANSSGDVRIIRLNSNMSQDMTFGTSGVTTVGIGGSDDHATGIAIRSDGKILVTGTNSAAASQGHFQLIQLNANGTKDTSFDGDGLYSPAFGSTGQANAVAWDSSNKIVVAGTIDGQMAVARFSGASPDTSFSGDGFQSVAVGSASTGLAVAVQGTSKIVVAGSSGSNFALARLTA